jgi:uncharacterized Fe-S radical SAM superfamily protein PflX
MMARDLGLTLPVVFNCGGYESLETIRFLAPYVDVWIRILNFSARFWREKWQMRRLFSKSSQRHRCHDRACGSAGFS